MGFLRNLQESHCIKIIFTRDYNAQNLILKVNRDLEGHETRSKQKHPIGAHFEPSSTQSMTVFRISQIRFNTALPYKACYKISLEAFTRQFLCKCVLTCQTT
jgi:hypothetical protein